MLFAVAAASLLNAQALRLTLEVKELGLSGTGTILLDRTDGRYVRTFYAGPASDYEGYDGANAWIADATGNAFVQGESDAKTGILRWAQLFRNFGESSLPRVVKLRQGPDMETIVFSHFRCVVANFCPPFAISIKSQGGERFIRILKIDPARHVGNRAFLAPPAPNDASILSPSGVAVVPTFPEMFQGSSIPLTIFQARINGFTAPLRFVLDSGGQNVLTPRVAQRLGVHTYGAIQVGGAGANTVASRLAWVDRVRIGDAELRHQPFLVFPLAGVLPDIDGMVGAELLSRFVTRMDFANNTIQFARVAPTAWSVGADTTALKLFQTAPVVSAAMDGVSGQFLIDTGAAGSVDINAPFATSNSLFRTYGGGSGALNGVGGSVSVANITVGKFELGNSTFKGVPATLALPGGGSSDDPSVAGVIGQKLLRRFSAVTMDYKRSLIFFEK